MIRIVAAAAHLSLRLARAYLFAARVAAPVHPPPMSRANDLPRLQFFQTASRFAFLFPESPPCTQAAPPTPFNSSLPLLQQSQVTLSALFVSSVRHRSASHTVALPRVPFLLKQLSESPYVHNAGISATALAQSNDTHIPSTTRPASRRVSAAPFRRTSSVPDVILQPQNLARHMCPHMLYMCLPLASHPHSATERNSYGVLLSTSIFILAFRATLPLAVSRHYVPM